MLRSYAVQSNDVGLILEQANNLFIRDTFNSSMFVTVFSAIYDPVKRQLNYLSCGHPPALIVRANGAVEKLSTPGLAIGVTSFEALHQATLQLQQGDLMLLYTDGITEAQSPEETFFGEERLSAFLQANRTLSADQLLDLLIGELQAFAQGRHQYDDITVVVLKVM